MIYLYALARNGKVFYVGKTCNLEQRFRRHRSDWGRDITTAILDKVEDRRTADLGERAWILYFAHRFPLQNVQHNPFWSYANPTVTERR